MQRDKAILVALGPEVRCSLMTDDMKAILLHTFFKFPDVTFIWRFEHDENGLAQNQSNVVTSTWVPKSDILGKCKAVL